MFGNSVLRIQLKFYINNYFYIKKLIDVSALSFNSKYSDTDRQTVPRRYKDLGGVTLTNHCIVLKEKNLPDTRLKGLFVNKFDS